jgi:hypothetical protein
VQGGLPPGFAVESALMHIYANGQEYPTNLSRNRVEVTEDEAHEFLILQHIQNHRQDSLPAQLIPELVPSRLPGLIAREQRDALIEVTINRHGRVADLAPGPGATPDLVLQLGAELRRVRFLPALVHGAAMDGMETLALSELVPNGDEHDSAHE